MKKVGIACGCRKLNYGSILQSYALSRAVKKVGCDCSFVWVRGNLFKHYNIRLQKLFGVACTMVKHPVLIKPMAVSLKNMLAKQPDHSISPKSMQLFDAFKRESFDIRLYSYSELKRREAEYDVFLCGSDQIWNSYEYWMDPMYFLRFTREEKRVAYAPSFGESSVSSYNYRKIKKYISSFKSLSVRETAGAEICKQLIGREVEVVLDPTLLLSKEEWVKELELEDDAGEGPYCLAYFLNYPSAGALEAINLCRREVPVKALPYAFDCFEEEERTDAGPREFVRLIKNAAFVLTDSFHGTAFSIDFQKDFITFRRQYSGTADQSSRLDSILSQLSLTERYVEGTDSGESLLHERVDYSQANEKLQRLRDRSFAYLKAALQ